MILGKGKHSILGLKLEAGDVIESVETPPPVLPMTYVRSYKFAPRSQLSQSIVGGTCFVRTTVHGQVSSLRLGLVGVEKGSITVLGETLELSLKDKEWSPALLPSLLRISESRFTP